MQSLLDSSEIMQPKSSELLTKRHKRSSSSAHNVWPLLRSKLVIAWFSNKEMRSF